LIFDPATHRVLGGGIVGPNAGELIAEVALAIEMGADAVDIGLTIHPHPTLSESIGMAGEAFEGTLIDLYLPKKKMSDYQGPTNGPEISTMKSRVENARTEPPHRTKEYSWVYPCTGPGSGTSAMTCRVARSSDLMLVGVVAIPSLFQSYSLPWD